jgi:ubiquitin-like modifier-activating enzyme ATG7|tara:strand:- start:434 stop:985 length:552 start_codon:yes stop_codon:yes gene_type:complete
MRHGHACEAEGAAADTSSAKTGGTRLGCYFCNDIVAPLDSTRARTLDQQCTVTRPGLAPIASALAVELMVTLLHHPLRASAPADDATPISKPSAQPLGLLPHQIRGFVSHFDQLLPKTPAFPRCVACAPSVVAAFRRDNWSFVERALREPAYLEEITGLVELQNAAAIDDFADFDDSDDDGMM